MRKIICAAVALSVLGLYGCGSSGGDDPEPVAQTVQAFGKAHLEAPIVGARVELQDANGRVLPNSTSTTGVSGVFSLPVEVSHSPYFRVVIQGGTHEGKPFKDTLLLEVEQFDTRKHVLYVNALTTLVSQHHKRSAGQALSEAESQVQRYLKVPLSARAAIAIANPYQKFFSHRNLLQAAQNSGATSLNSYLEGLQAEVASGHMTRPFPKQEAGSKLADPTSEATQLKADALGSIMSLASGLLHSLGDETFSGVFEAILTQMGLGGTAEILHELHQISAKLDELAEQVNDLGTAVEEGQIQAIVLTLLNHVSTIHTNYDQMTLRVEATADLPTCELDREGNAVDASCAAQWKMLQERTRVDMAAILDTNVGVVKALEAIRMALPPTQGVDAGLLSRAFEHFKNDKPFFAPVVDPRLIAIKDYYQGVLYIGTSLVVDASMGDSSIDRVTAKNAVDKLVNALAAQDAQVERSKLDNPHVVIDQTTGMVWERAPLSNLPYPYPVDPKSDYYSAQAAQRCEQQAATGFAGIHTWRLPTDPEFHALVNKTESGSPVSGDAESGSGVFAWLVSQGFTDGGNVSLDARSVSGLLQNNAYFSSTKSGTTGNFYEALWDTGVDYACITFNSTLCNLVIGDGNTTMHAGAWCVAEGERPAGHE